MIYFIWKCKDCNNEFKEPKVDDFIYGQFVLYSATTKSKRYFDNSNVSVFEEVDMIIENNHRYKHVKERKKERDCYMSKCFQHRLRQRRRR